MCWLTYYIEWLLVLLQFDYWILVSYYVVLGASMLLPYELYALVEVII